MTAVLGTRRSPACVVDKPVPGERPHPEDAVFLLPTRIPPPIQSKANDVWRVGKYTFRADFDSANLDSVEPGPGANEFYLQTRRDCGGTANEKATRTWFYFTVYGHSAGDLIVCTILNMNKQSRLYSQDYRPVFWCASQQEWQPLRLRVTYRRDGEDFQLRFCHRFDTEEETLFAFAFPFSYQQTQDMLDHLDEQLPPALYGNIPPAAVDPAAALLSEALSHVSIVSPRVAPIDPLAETDPGLRPGLSAARYTSDLLLGSSVAEAPASRIYYRRQLLTQSLEGRRVEVVTITDCSGATGEVEPALPGVFQHDSGPPAPVFRDKTVFFVSSRVHPGETPATHIFNGMLAFLLRRSDPRAAALRRRFVFKLVPLVNPDGVAVGNYRTDTLGQNLNRYYNGQPDEATQPSVFAIKGLLMHYAQQGVLEYYIDLHAHANKKGVFIFGNTLDDGEAHLQSLVYAKLVALNNPSFDFVGCNYTEKNMSRPDKDGISKEGAGRVALFRETGLTHLYTIEANYNTARTLNVVAPAAGDHGGRVSPPCNKRFPPKFTVGAFHGVGRAILIAALDMESLNPWSRLPNSEHRNLDGVRSWILTVLRATPEVRAAHLPPMSDAAVDTLRNMVVSGALRGAAGAPPSAQRARARTTGFRNGDSTGYSAGMSPAPITTVAFGRTVVAPRRLTAPPPPPPPQPTRRASAALPVITSALTGLPPTSPACVGLRRSCATVGPVGGGAGDGGLADLARSSSVPVRCSTPLVNRPPPRVSIMSTTTAGPNGKEAEVEVCSPVVFEAGCEELEAADTVGTAPSTEAPPRPSADGFSDSDGDAEFVDGPSTASPASAGAAVTPAQARVRLFEPPLRVVSSSSFKGSAVYCGRMTEFKFPLDWSPGCHEGNPVTGSLGSPALLRTLMHASDRNASINRGRPSSASSTSRPLSAGGRAATPVGSLNTSNSGGVASTTGGVGAAAGGAGGSGGWHLAPPRALSTTATVLGNSEQLAAPTAAPTPRIKSTLSFARSTSANRKNR